MCADGSKQKNLIEKLLLDVEKMLETDQKSEKIVIFWYFLLWLMREHTVIQVTRVKNEKIKIW